ncbi:MAG: dipeptidase, partial [Planctomycetes bacterium]|nr:dipeptidase [Planctomycetota bacterium]
IMKMLDGFLDEAMAIHRDCVVADGHSDFPYRAIEEGANIVTGEKCQQISLGQMSQVNHRIQGAALYTPPEYTGFTATQYALNMLGNLRRLVDDNEDKLEFIRQKSQLEKYAKNETSKFGLIIWLEGVSPIAGDFSNLETFLKLGLKGAGITHNVKNEAAFGCSSKSLVGLTPFGCDLVRQLEKSKVILDLAHINEPGFYEILEITENPVVVSHTGIRSIRGNVSQRLLTDAQVKEVAQRQGIVGIDYYPWHIGRKQAENDYFADVDDVFAVIDHGVSLVGEDFIGLGSDFDGFNDTTQGLAKVEDVLFLTARLIKAGYAIESIRKILSENWLRVLRELL